MFSYIISHCCDAVSWHNAAAITFFPLISSPMPPSQTRPIALIIFATVTLAACGKHAVAPGPAPVANAAVAAAGAAPAPVGALAPDTFSVDQVPLTNAKLPPFPLLSFPDALPQDVRNNDQEYAFEEAYVVAGSSMRKVEGRLSTRFFGNAQAGTSASGSRRNYQQALEALGAVKVNTVKPTDPELVSKNGGDVEKVLAKMRLMDAGPRFEDRGIATYDCYLIRTADGNTWVTVATDSDGLNTFLMTVQEKPLRQSVSALSAESMASSLKADGHLALYLSFDTDQTRLRGESTAVIAEIVKLMRADPGLRLRIEGHTDNVGNEAHNQVLSAGRAQSVKAALVAQQIDGTRMDTSGLGATRPIADNASEAGRVKNRRVELVKL
jgi:OOP family OmpA-OmpF porin